MRGALPASYVDPFSSLASQPALAVSSSRSLATFDSVGMRPLNAANAESSLSGREKTKPLDSTVVRDPEPRVSGVQNGQRANNGHLYHRDSSPPSTSKGCRALCMMYSHHFSKRWLYTGNSISWLEDDFFVQRYLLVKYAASAM